MSAGERVDPLAVLEEVLTDMARDGLALDMYYESVDQASAAVTELVAAGWLYRRAHSLATGTDSAERRALAEELGLLPNALIREIDAKAFDQFEAALAAFQVKP